MLPGSLLSCRRRDTAIVPDYLGPHDYPWLRALIDEYERFASRPVRQLRQRLKEPLSPDGPERRKLRALRVLERMCHERVEWPVKPTVLRQTVFDRAAEAPMASSERIFEQAAAALGISSEVARLGLFADLPGERRVGRIDPTLDPLRLSLEANLVLAQGFVRRASEVRLELCGRARDVIRLAQLQGLIATVESIASGGTDAVVTISGPLSLFRRTSVYGRALATLVPGLAWCDRFRVEARCLIDERTVAVELRSGDPIFPSAEPRRFDSRLEERFARELARAATDWDIIREPEPIQTAHGLLFPDFAVEHRRDRSRRWLVEIVGFWTDDYLERKLSGLRSANIDNLILCVDAARACADDTLPCHARIVPFRRRVPTADVLRIIDPRSMLADVREQSFRESPSSRAKLTDVAPRRRTLSVGN